MSDTPRQPPTVEQLVRFLIQQMKPVSKLANSMEDPNQSEAIDTMIRLQQETVLAVDRIHERLERLESRLSQPPPRR
jgi:hypothetical protein